MTAGLNDKKKLRLPSELIKLIKQHQHNSNANCVECSSLCCLHGGFAILENVVAIYGMYRRKHLIRQDYRFRENLSFKGFVGTYFDISLMPDNYEAPVFFHTRVLSKNNTLITENSTHNSKCNADGEPFDIDNITSRGCVFLNRKIPIDNESDETPSTTCTLHSPDNETHITAKPINCVLFTCQRPLVVKQQDARFSYEWIQIINKAYPNSARRFRKLLKNESAVDELLHDIQQHHNKGEPA